MVGWKAVAGPLRPAAIIAQSQGTEGGAARKMKAGGGPGWNRRPPKAGHMSVGRPYARRSMTAPKALGPQWLEIMPPTSTQSKLLKPSLATWSSTARLMSSSSPSE